MKIGICTIVDYNNYGNRLQNYALQEVLLKCGHEVITIKNEHKGKKTLLEKARKVFSFKSWENKINEKIIRIKFKEIDRLRDYNFKEFSTRFINETINSFSNDDIFLEIDNCDCFVIGSDQVWNYSFPRFSSFDFGSFTNKPKISYAASFGVNSIPLEFHNTYKEGLVSLDCISVRELAGKELVLDLINKESEVVLDPTLLLTKEEWNNLVKSTKKYSTPYLLTYFLNEPDDNTLAYIEQLAEKNNLTIKKMCDRSQADLWTADPAEFVNLFSQAEYVCTDSFHACVFSIIFEKQFEIFERNTSMPSMNSRIDTLFNTLELNRWHGKNIESIDYKKTNNLLAIERNSSMKYLDNALLNIESNKKIT